MARRTKAQQTQAQKRRRDRRDRRRRKQAKHPRPYRPSGSSKPVEQEPTRLADMDPNTPLS